MRGELGVSSQAVSEIEHLGVQQPPSAQAFHLPYKALNTLYLNLSIVNTHVHTCQCFQLYLIKKKTQDGGKKKISCVVTSRLTLKVLRVY